MQYQVNTIEEYLSSIPEERKATVEKLYKTVKSALPKGFTPTINYGMIGFVISHKDYPAGYHCDPKQPLPFINIASQKNNISLYHMGMYMMPDVLNWFKEEWANTTKAKLDMGKSCVRFKKPQDIPYDLIKELCKKITPAQYIKQYESLLKK